jgi:hypothetical protein
MSRGIRGKYTGTGKGSTHTGGIHLKPVDSSLKACGLGGKKSDALGKAESQDAILGDSTTVRRKRSGVEPDE